MHACNNKHMQCRDRCACLLVLQNRYMKAAKDWGWREFVTLHTLFDADAGYLLSDDAVFAAEVLMLRESSDAKQARVAALGTGHALHAHTQAGSTAECWHARDDML